MVLYCAAAASFTWQLPDALQVQRPPPHPPTPPGAAAAAAAALQSRSEKGIHSYPARDLLISLFCFRQTC